VPRQRRQADRREDEEARDDAGPGGRDVTGHAGQRIQRSDDGEVLEQSERPLALEAVAEDVEPQRQHVERGRPVEVQEVLVRCPTVLDETREDEHEALFHRRSRSEEQAAQRQEDGGEQGAQSRPVDRAECGRTPARTPAQYERGRGVGRHGDTVATGTSDAPRRHGAVDEIEPVRWRFPRPCRLAVTRAGSAGADGPRLRSLP
jgi:hypothetical protein